MYRLSQTIQVQKIEWFPDYSLKIWQTILFGMFFCDVGWGNRIFEISRRLIAKNSQIPNPTLRWGWVFFKSFLQNDVCRFGRSLTGLFSQQILLNLIKLSRNQHVEIFMNETNMRRFESVSTNHISSSWHQKSKISKRIVLIDSNAGRRTKFALVKSLDSSEFSSEFSDLETL